MTRIPRSTGRPAKAQKNRKTFFGKSGLFTPNSSKILRLIRHAEISGQPTSRAEISRETGLTAQTVSNIVAALCDAALVRPAGRRTSGSGSAGSDSEAYATGRGQPPVVYETNPDGAFALGFEIRADSMICTLMNFRGKAVFWDKNPLSDTSPESLRTEALALFQDALVLRPSAGQKLLGAALISTQGTNAGSKGTEHAQILSETVGINVEPVPAAGAVAIGERISGAVPGMNDYVTLWFPEPVPGGKSPDPQLGIVVRGRMLTGVRGKAGAVGNLTTCAGSGFPPDALNTASLCRHFETAGIPFTPSATKIEAHYKAGTPALLAWIEQARPALKQLVLHTTAFLDPGALVLNGGLPSSVLNALTTDLLPGADRPQLLCGNTGEMAAALGAAAVVLNQVFTDVP